MSNIIYFNKELKDVDDKILAKIGIRGRRAVELANMALPIVPGFIIDSELTLKLPQTNIKEQIVSYISQLKKRQKKSSGITKKLSFLKLI